MKSQSSRNGLSRRGLLGMAGAAAAVPFLEACGAGAPAEETGGSGKSSGGAFTVYWNAGHNYEAYQKVIAEFEKAHGLKVNLQKFQWPDMRTRILADFSSGTVPDVVEEPGGWVLEFAQTGDVLSLRDYVSKDGAAMGFPGDWQDRTVERNTYQGKVFGIQLHLTCTALFYNKEMLSAAGIAPPTTWDDFLAAAKELTKGTIHGTALNQDAGYVWSWLLQNGVTPYDPETKQLLTPNDAAIEALQFLGDLVHKHKVSSVPVAATDYSGPQKLWSAGRAAMFISGPWDLDPIAKSSPDLQLGIAQPLQRKVQATNAAGTSIFIPKKAARPDLSWDFIKRMTALKVELAATAETGMLMPRKSWADDSAVRKNQRAKPLADAFDVAVDPAKDLILTGKSGQISEIHKTMYQSVVMQNKPADQAVKEYLEAGQKILKG